MNDESLTKPTLVLSLKKAHFVYFLFNDVNELVYVGSTSGLFARLGVHQTYLGDLITFCKVFQYPDPKAAREAERKFILGYQPKFNDAGKIPRLTPPRCYPGHISQHRKIALLSGTSVSSVRKYFKKELKSDTTIAAIKEAIEQVGLDLSP